MEVWKDVPNYLGVYQVSNLGNVKSLSRQLRNKWNVFQSKEKWLTPKKNSGGYLWVKFCVNNTEKSYAVHRLVMLCFNGDSKLVVNHKDGNQTNNNLENLEYCSQRENAHHYLNKASFISKYIGVSYDSNRKKWSAKIKVKGKTVNLGRFKNEIEAHNKYKEYAAAKGLSSRYS